MKKPKDMIKDDELLREEGMCDGPTKIGNIEMRPITALSVSWMQRNQIFSDSKDMIWRSAAFAFLHAAPKSDIRLVVNDADEFANAVDAWIDENILHHSETTKIAEAMNRAFERYMSATSESVGNDGAIKN